MNEQKKRLLGLLSKAGIALGLGLAYALFVRFTGWGIPCVFHLLTGLHCPGCGISRMFLALLRLDFAAAARYNLLVLCLLPCFLALYGYKAWRYVQTGAFKTGKAETVFYIVALVLCGIFFILRNTGAVPFFTLP